MAVPPIVPGTAPKLHTKFFQRSRNIVLLVLAALLVLCVVFIWTTGDVMSDLPFTPRKGPRPSWAAKKTIVDQSPWETAQTLAALAVTAEEHEYAREAERLADHEVDQAFAAALRQGTIQAQHRSLTGNALALSQKADQLQQVVIQDKALVKQLSPPAGSSTDSSDDDTDLEIAKAQLQLDSDQLNDAQEELARASGDRREQIQSELTAHEAATRKHDSDTSPNGQIAVLSVGRYGTLAGRLAAWNRQRSRYQLVQQALQQTQNDIRALTDQHSALEAQANKMGSGTDAADRTTRLANIKDRSAERQLLTIFDDRIQTEQQLAAIYDKWGTQILRQHRIVLHRMLQSTAVIVVLLICMVLGSGLVRRMMSYPRLDTRQAQTLRMVLELGIQVVGALLILIVLFGVPHETPTILGLATAALTIALQDFVLAFFGWFVLMGKRGVRVGDWVEINGVGGEVVEVGLMRTTLLETGNLADRGYPTGRRISFMNSFAIRGQYFNFSTTGQWMWDEITVAVPSSLDMQTTMERIFHMVQKETEDNARQAEQEWKRGTHGQGLSKFRTDPAVNLRPSGSELDVEVRYVTRASDRFEMRNRLYRQVVGLLHESTPQPEAQVAL